MQMAEGMSRERARPSISRFPRHPRRCNLTPSPSSIPGSWSDNLLQVRCDRRKNTCGTCARLGLTCSLPLPSPDPHDEADWAGKPRRLRGVRACHACRGQKVRCSGDTPSCTRCTRRGHPCSYPPLKRPIKIQEASESSRSSSTPPSEERNDGTPVQSTPASSRIAISEAMLALVDTFFEAIYPLPSYAFLHPETTKKRCRDGQFHTALTFALCAMAAQHMGSASDRERASQWIQDAEQSVWQHLGCPTVPRLQTLLLIIHHSMETGRFERAFMLMALAARFAFAMRLNQEQPQLDPVAREVRRRILWSLKIIERYFAHGITQYEVCPAESIYINFPLAEEGFDRGHPAELGAYSLTVRLEWVRRDIIKLTRNLVSLKEPLEGLILRHQQTLNEIGAMMPDGTELSAAQIPDLLHSPWLPRRILMHISFHGAHFDLYRILLQGYPEAAPARVLEGVPRDALDTAERECLHHATSIIQLLTTLNQQSSSHRLFEFDTAICVYQAVRLLLFISRFGRCPEKPTPEFAASRVDLCIAALRRFFPTSVLVSPIIEELERLNKALAQQRQEQRRQQLAQRHQAGVATALSPVSSSPTLVGDLDQDNRSGSDARERLAIHSLLRQARFSHGEEDDDHNNDNARPEQRQSHAVPTPAEGPRQDMLPLTTPDAVPAPPVGALDDPAPANVYPSTSMDLERASSLNTGFGIADASWDLGPSYVMDDGDDVTEAEAMPLSIFPWLGRQEDWDLFFGPNASVPT